MKSDLRIGTERQMIITVTEDMFATFGDELVHPTYSTVSMVYHMEWVARDLLIPYLEKDEEGMGAKVVVKHLAPSLVDSRVTLTATVTDITPKRVTTTIKIENENGIIGEGEVVQAVLPKSKIEAMLNVEKSI